MNKKRVLFFIQSELGGAERVTINIANMLLNANYQVSFVIVGSGNAIEKFLPLNTSTHHIRVGDIRFWGVARIIYFIMKTKADFVFSSIMYINIRVLLAGKICRTKVIVRNNNMLRLVSWRIRVLMKLTYKFAYKIIAQQEEMQQEIVNTLEIPSPKVVCLFNPIDFKGIESKLKETSPYSCANDQIKYLWVARFSKNKGQDILIQAFDKIRSHNSKAHLYFVGNYKEGEETYDYVKKYVEDHKMNSCVHFMGFQENPYKWIKNCDCFVMPSRLEGLPNALLDATYMKIPVVGTNCVKVVNVIVKDGYNGYVVPVEDVEQLAIAMINALSLHNFNMTYKPSVNEEFISLFM